MTAQESSAPSSRTILGSCALFGGIMLLALRGAQSAHALAGMPSFWHNHDALWWALGFAAVFWGVSLIVKTSSTSQSGSWQPTRSGRRFQKLILYTRADCQLCHEARDILADHGRWLPEIVEIDIDHDPRLVERYGTCVPVVSLDGKVRFRGRVPVELLRRLIEGTPPVGM